MSIPVVAFFNNKGGVGKTSLVYHLAWMLSDMGIRVLAADLDPQSNLTAACLDDSQIDMFWNGTAQGTVFDCIHPLVRGVGDISAPVPVELSMQFGLIPGDLRLSGFEDELSGRWPEALSRIERPFRVLSAFWRIVQQGARAWGAEVILMDLGPNLGAINRTALISADYVVVPLAPDLFSLQGLRNLGNTFVSWRQDWKDRLDRKPPMDIELPAGRIQPLGYVVLQHSIRMDRPVKAYEKWIGRIPGDYRKYVLCEDEGAYDLRSDPHNLALLKHYRSLMPMAQEARKPIFHLKPADGAIGSHWEAAREAGSDFHRLAQAILKRVLPDTGTAN